MEKSFDPTLVSMEMFALKIKAQKFKFLFWKIDPLFRNKFYKKMPMNRQHCWVRDCDAEGEKNVFTLFS